METCRECPAQYPWLGDSEGTGIVNRDNYIYASDGNGDTEQDDVEERRK